MEPKEINDKLQEIIDRGDFGDSFDFRKGQRKAIIKTCWHILNKTKSNVIIDAPTGSGKSIISIVAAKLLTEYGLTGYIVTSDLGLQDQYMKDVENFQLGWGCIKGVDNYLCDVNERPFSVGECRSRGYGNEKAKELPCWKTCGYLQNREKSINSAVSILNYSYWLIQRNYASKKEAEKGIPESFKKRDFVFFDEAHKIDDIVQNHFAPRINLKIIETLEDLNKFLLRTGIISVDMDLLDIMLKWNYIMTNQTEAEDIASLKVFRRVLAKYLEYTTGVRNQIEHKFPFGKKIPMEWNRALKQLDFIKDVHCKIDDYILIVNESILVKTINGEEALFNILDDRSLLNSNLHSQCNFGVFLSATFGNCIKWADLTNTVNYELLSIPVDWDWTRSPIILTKGPKLNYASKEASLPACIQLTDKLIDKHPNQKGVLHTGSYGFNESIIKNSRHSKRFISYKTSEEKRFILPEFFESKDKILIGPSLIEGLDLKDDLCRFQIFFKVPYRMLTDEYVKKKMKNDSDWYNWKALIQFTQGLGRGVRNENDWATSYLIDGCFQDFIRRNINIMDKSILDRLKYL